GGPSRLWRYDDFGSSAALEGSENLRAMLNLRGGWNIEGEVARNFFHIDPVLYPGVTVPAPGGGFVPYAPEFTLRNLWRPQLTINTPVRPTFDASAGYTGGGVPIFDEGSEGREQRYDLSLGIRPTAGIRL